MFEKSFIFLLCTFLSCFCSHPFCTAKDTMKHGDQISEDQASSSTTSLVSAGGRFELGFFSPDGKNKYIGIWYHNLTSTSPTSKTNIVWVANRNDPIRYSSGVFGFADDGNLKLMDKDNRSREAYWSTGLKNLSPSSNCTVQLMDSGNLVVNGSETEVLWQSFENPTDTFLPGMRMDGNIKLISWRDRGDPGEGQFKFKQDQDREGQFMIMKQSVTYWVSWDNDTLFSSSEDIMPGELVAFLSETEAGSETKRLVIEWSGKAEFGKWDPEMKVWSTSWWGPKDMCSRFNVCGNFGSCNRDVENRLACNCLPGFKPRIQQKWDSEDYSDGCARGKELCSGGEGEKEMFLSLRTVKVGKRPGSPVAVPVSDEIACREVCKDNCTCQAYSFQTVLKQQSDSVVPKASCWIWHTDHLHSLLDDHKDSGATLFVRLALSDLKPTPRTCNPCGTNTIPYPLSTGPDCGDPMYSSLWCNNSTGRVSFNVSGEEYRVTSINPSKNRFVIQVKEKDNRGVRGSRSKNQPLNPLPPFNVMELTPWGDNEFGNLTELNIAWDPPFEPTCATQESCKGWPNSSCRGKGKKRCLCNKNFEWDDLNLTCIGERFSNQAGGPDSSTRRREVPLYLIVLPTVLLTVLIMACAVFYFLWRRKMAEKDESNKLFNRRNIELRALDSEKRIKHLMDSSEFKDDEKGIDVPFFDFESILDATDDFSDENKLGQGGYGPVYKGKFPGGQEVAIKRLSSVSGQGLQEFKNEVILIARLQHRNLVKLLGYCMQRDEKILIYEYMPNKSLDFFVFDDKMGVFLEWKMRFEIVLGIARGMLYLHQDSRLRIIHRDLKTSNILLDKEMNPKIADFGLARIVGGKETEANTNRVVGTYGYMSPEYALEGIFSVKSDVYSFGVVLLEIISGKRNTKFVLPEGRMTLPGYAWRLWTENKVLNLMCQSLRESCKEGQFIKCVNVALLCVQEDPNDRPNMSNVITMLDSETSTLPSPIQPAFTVRRGGLSTGASSTSSKQETHSEITFTVEDTR